MNLLNNYYFSDINVRYQVGGPFSIGKNMDWSYHESVFAQNKFYFITQGRCTITIAGKTIEGKPGRWFFIPAGIPHAYANDNSMPFRKCWVHFDVDNDDEGIMNLLNLPYYVDADVEETEKLFAKQEQFKDTNSVSECFLKKAFVLELIAKYISIANCEKILVEKTKDEMLNKALAYIEENLGEEITVERLAEVCHLHPTHFIRIFKKRMGVTPARFIKTKRLEYAKKLIEETEISLSQVAEKIGCSGLANFSKMYKSYFGVSPKNYRRHLRTMEASRDKNS